jgi:hypothetical protein
MVGLASQPMQYLGCYGIFHAPCTVQTETALIAQFEQFAELYPFAAPAFKAVCRHARMDYSLGHQEIALERIVKERMPDGFRALAILRGASGVATLFRQIFDAIHESTGALH